MKKIIITIISVVIIAVITGISIYNTPTNRIGRHLDLGQKYLEEQDYEQAIVEFDKAIEIDPMNVEAYKGLADAYIGQGDYDKAVEVLQKGYELTANEELKRKLESLFEDEQETENINAEDNSYLDQAELSVNEEPDEIDQKIEKLEKMFIEGYTDDMLRIEEVNFFEHDIDSMSLENMGSILTENGYILLDNDLNRIMGDNYAYGCYLPWISGTDDDGDGKVEWLCFRSDNHAIEEKHMPIGVRNIYTYDTLEKVLTEIGFSNGREIWEYINATFAGNVQVDNVNRCPYSGSGIKNNNSNIGRFDFDIWCDAVEGSESEVTFDRFIINIQYPNGLIDFTFEKNEGVITHLMDYSVYINNN